MVKKKQKAAYISSLEQRAEDALETLSSDNGDSVKFSPDNMKTLIHDLQLHQIELKIQNDELRRTQKELTVSRERYFDLYDLAPLGYITVSEKGLLLETNLTAATMLGKYRNEMIKNPISSFILSMDQDIYYRHRKLLFETGEPQKFELRMVQTDKLHLWVQMDMVAAQNEDGSPVCRIAISDITERKKAEESLQEHEEQYRAVVDNIGDYIMRYDKSFRHIYANRLALEVTGLPIDQYIGKTHREMGFPDHLCELWRKNIQLVFDTGKQQNIEFDVELVEGKMSLELQLNPEFAVDGSVKTVIGISRDITSRKQAEVEKLKLESRLQQAQKMESIGTLAGGIAHDFNNLLYPIIGFSEMLKEDLPPDSPEHESAQEIFNAGRRGGELVKQILAFSRQAENKLSPVRFQKILKEVCKLTRSTIPSDIKIHNNIQKDCGSVMAESTQLHQIAMNLITNAYHAVEKASGKISIQLKEIILDNDDLKDSPLQPGQYAMLSVSDDGVGIPKEIMNNIFEPYFTTKEKGKGTGLGLAVVYGILTEHKGDIKVYSEVGKGTTFNVYLPLMKKSTESISTETVLDKLTGTERILLVDDEKSVVRLEKQMLERLGYNVSALSNSLEALETFNSNPDGYDLVISDMTMPNMTGDQLAIKLMSIRPDIPIVICTGFSERINKEQAEAHKVKGFLMKPVVKSEMAQMVRKVLDEAKIS